MKHEHAGQSARRARLAAAVGTCMLTAAILGCVSERQSATAPHRPAPSFAIDGVTAVTCDLDITINAGLDSADLRAANSVTYTFHLTGNANGGSPIMTATVDQAPGLTLNLLSAPLAGPVPYQSSGPGSPPAPDVSTWMPPTQATFDSLAQKPLDGFCNVVRDLNGVPYPAQVVGSQGSVVQATTYPNSVVATVTSDAATGLPVEEVVTVNGTVMRDTQYGYASASGAVYRASLSVSTPYLIEGQPVNTLMQITTRNVVRTTGGQ